MLIWITIMWKNCALQIGNVISKVLGSETNEKVRENEDADEISRASDAVLSEAFILHKS